jgi:hypothetical protein
MITMGCESSRIGVCVIRIEVRRNGVLITLQENADIEQISTERTSTKADIDVAVLAVRRFLQSFADSTGSAEIPKRGRREVRRKR